MFKTLHRTRNFPAPGAVTADLNSGMRYYICFRLCSYSEPPGTSHFQAFLNGTYFLTSHELGDLPTYKAASTSSLFRWLFRNFLLGLILIFPGSFIFRFLGDPNPPPILCTLGYQDNYCDFREGENHLGPFSTIWNSSFQEGISPPRRMTKITDCCMRITLKEQSYCSVGKRQSAQ